MKRLLLIRQLSFFFVAISLLFFSTTVSFAQWSQLSPEVVGGTLPERRSLGMARISEDRIIMFGGYDGSNALGDTWLYEINENRWTNLSPAIIGGTLTARLGMGLVHIDGDQVIMFGGWSPDTGFLGDTWLYDLSDNIWKQITPTVVGGTLSIRSNMSICNIGDGRAIMFGGKSGTNYLNETWLFEIANNTWTKLTPTVTGGTLSERQCAGSDYLGDNKIMIFGGSSTIYYNDTWIYDISSNEWTKHSPTYSGGVLSSMTATQICRIGENRAALFSGRLSSGSYVNETWLYNLTVSQWSKLDLAGVNGLPAIRAWAGLLNISKNKCILFGGSDSSTAYNDTWLLRIPDLGADSLQYENLSTGVQITWSWNLPADFTGISFFVYKNGQKISSAITQGTQENGAMVFSYTDENIVSGTIGKYQVSEVNSYTGIETIYPQELVVPYCQ